jgi:hypothetical protein
MGLEVIVSFVARRMNKAECHTTTVQASSLSVRETTITAHVRNIGGVVLFV